MNSYPILASYIVHTAKESLAERELERVRERGGGGGGGGEKQHKINTVRV